MIDKSQLSKQERMELEITALEKKKKSIEDELEDMKYNSVGLKNGKQSVKEMKNYFKDLWKMQDDKEFLQEVKNRKKRQSKRKRISLNDYAAKMQIALILSDYYSKGG